MLWDKVWLLRSQNVWDWKMNRNEIQTFSIYSADADLILFPKRRLSSMREQCEPPVRAA